MPARSHHPPRRAAASLLAVLLAASVLVGWPQPARGADLVELTFVATNDFHRRLAPIDDPGTWNDGLGGAAWLATHLDRVRDRAPGTLHVDAGDMTGSGRPGIPAMVGTYADEATVDVMNTMGLDVTTVGNHEFDYGPESLRRSREGGCWQDDCGYRHDQPWHGAEFETLSSNVVDNTTEQTFFPPSTIIETNGVQVGFVGATETTLIPDVGGRLSLLDPLVTVNSAVEAVKAQGADLVVVLWHNGSKQHPGEGETYDHNGCANLDGPSADFAPYFADGVEAVVDGHTHHAYVCDEPGQPLLTQASHRGGMYTEITLTWDRDSEEVVDRTAVNRLVAHDVAPDPEVAAVVEEYAARLRVPAQPSADLDEDTLGDALEAFTTGTAPRIADTDDDRVNDGAEATVVNIPDDCSRRPFRDVATGNTFCPEIAWMDQQAISTGYADDTYRPATDVTRGAMAAFMARLAGATPDDCTARPFTDVPTTHTFCPEIAWMDQQAISTGYADDTYRPATDVTRGAMAAFMARLAGATPDDCTARPFTDVPTTHTFCPEIAWMDQQAISTGYADDTYRPATDVTRGAMAAFMARLADASRPPA